MVVSDFVQVFRRKCTVCVTPIKKFRRLSHGSFWHLHQRRKISHRPRGRRWNRVNKKRIPQEAEPLGHHGDESDIYFFKHFVNSRNMDHMNRNDE